ncbi:hypothetical protein [Spirosoma fluminis]
MQSYNLNVTVQSASSTTRPSAYARQSPIDIPPTSPSDQLERSAIERSVLGVPVSSSSACATCRLAHCAKRMS